jgi:predicted Co/Zn/Cd cation transporter (cation efflux family)
VMFSLNNVGVVVLSTAVGWFFGERPSARVFWGMGLAILSILVLAF